jgi:hypothetical protein
MPVDKQALETAKANKNAAMEVYRQAVAECEEASTEALRQYEAGEIDADSFDALMEAIREDKMLAQEEKKAALRVFRDSVKAANSKGGGRKKASAEEPVG